MFNKKRQLEMALQDIPPHQSPKIDLEQYSTPSTIAADVLWNAYSIGDINDLKVVDLWLWNRYFCYRLFYDGC